MTTETPEKKEEKIPSAQGFIRRALLDLGGLASAILLIVSGVKMIDIRSASSIFGAETITQAFYHAIGWGVIGLGIFAGVFLVSLALKDKSMWP